VREGNRSDAQAFQGRKRVIESVHERLDGLVIEHRKHIVATVAMTINADAAIEHRPEPSGGEMIAIEVRQADCANVANAGAGSVHALGGRAWTEPGVDQHQTGRRAQQGAITRGTGSEDA